jgi:hypothetical protein
MNEHIPEVNSSESQLAGQTIIPDFRCDEAHIISLSDSDCISILVFIDGKSIQMQRPKEEKIIKALTRLNISLQKKSTKKVKSTKNKKKLAFGQCIYIYIVYDIFIFSFYGH